MLVFIFKILSKLQELSWGKVFKNLFGECMFCITLKDSLLGPFVSMLYFDVWIFCPEVPIYLQGV